MSAHGQDQARCQGVDQKPIKAMEDGGTGHLGAGSANPIADAGAGGNRQRQRHHVEEGPQVGGDLMAGCGLAAQSGNQQGHQGVRGDFNGDRGSVGQPQAQHFDQFARMGRFHFAPKVQAAVVAAHQSQH